MRLLVRFIRLLLKGLGGLLIVVALIVAAIFAINATDQPLSEQARAAMRVAPPPEPARDNGFIDMLALAAPADAPTFETGVGQLELLRKQALSPDEGYLKTVNLDAVLPKCQLGDGSCLDAASRSPRLREVIEEHETLLRRYRAMRERPVFIELMDPDSPDDELASYLSAFQAQRLAFFDAALRFAAGERPAAARELEREFLFWSRVARDSRSLLSKMLAVAGLDRTLLFTADLARKMPRSDAALWRRLEAMLQPPTAAELDITEPARQEIARQVRWMQTRRFVRMSDRMYKLSSDLDGVARSRPWWDAVTPYLYRPNQNVNLYAAQTAIVSGITAYPATEFHAAHRSLLERARALEPAPWHRLFFSPIGAWYFLLGFYDFADYLGRLHGHAAVHNLVHLQLRLRAAGITRPAEVARALDGPLGRAYPYPFTGKPVNFDPKRSTLGFELEPKYVSGAPRGLMRNSKLALPL
jgi:hypothetical protein